jgi:hypothetical protein
MLRHNDQYTCINHIMGTLLHFALQGLYEIDFAKDFNLLSSTDKQQNTCKAYLLRLQLCQAELFFHSILQQVYYLRDPHLHRVYRSIMLTSQRNISVNFNIPSFGQLFYSQSPLYGYLAQYLYSLFSCSTEHSKREKCYYII